MGIGMGLLIIVILGVLSFAFAKILIGNKPEIVNWSVNRKQGITLVWFAVSVVIFLCFKATQQDFAIEQQLFSSIGTSIIMGMIFYKVLSPKKQTI